MVVVLLLAIMCTAGASHASYDEYSGPKMPFYGNDEYGMPSDTMPSRQSEDYQKPADAAASLGYKYEDFPSLKGQIPAKDSSDDSTVWKKSERKHREMIRPPKIDNRLFNGHDRDDEEALKLRNDRRYHRSRLKSENDERDTSPLRRRKKKYSRDMQDVSSDIYRKNFVHLDKDYRSGDKSKEFDDDKFLMDTPKKPSRRKPRDKQFKRQDNELEDYAAELEAEEQREREKDMRKENHEQDALEFGKPRYPTKQIMPESIFPENIDVSDQIAPGPPMPGRIPPERDLDSTEPKTPDISVLDRDDTYRNTVDRDVPDRDLQNQDVPDRDVPDRHVPDQDIPDRDLPNRQVPDRNKPDQDLPGRDQDLEMPEKTAPKQLLRNIRPKYEQMQDARRRFRPSFDTEEDIRGSLKKSPVRTKPKDYDDYEEYYDMKRAKNIKERLPTHPHRTTTAVWMTSSTEAITNLLDMLLTNRRMLPEAPPETTTTTSTTTRLTTVVIRPTTNATRELSLAEKSRLSILKKAQRKEGLAVHSTKKPPVLLQVTSIMPTVVMVEPPSPSVPWMRAKEILEDSPAKIEIVKRLMRQKLIAESKSIHDLTDNWDEMVCDYIDTSLLKESAVSAKSTFYLTGFCCTLCVFVL